VARLAIVKKFVVPCACATRALRLRRRQTHDLYIADVGQSVYEEVDFQPATALAVENYGWNVMEGSQCYNQSTCDTTA